MLVSGGCISKCIWNTRCIPWKSKSTKLCPLVGSGILYMNHPKDQPLCLVLDLQGISILSLPSAKTNMAMAIYLSQFETHLQMVDFLSNWLMPTMPRIWSLCPPLYAGFSPPPGWNSRRRIIPIRFSNGVVKLCRRLVKARFTWGVGFSHSCVSICANAASAWHLTSNITGWWFQPIWKILVKMGIFPK